MPDLPHLSHAPIIEAMVHFQANAAAHWQPAEVREKFSALWPDKTEIQEFQPIQLEFVAKAGQPPQQSVSFPGVEGFIFRSKSQPTVYHVRRDGFALSWLQPYSDWETFQARAFAGWLEYGQALQSPELHSVAIRFINRLEFPLADFRLSRYFTTPPQPPPGLNWGFYGFVQQAVFAVPNSGCAVHVSLSQAFDAKPDSLAYLLDVQVRLKESLAASGRGMEDVLAEMRTLKNTAFSGLLTPEAISRYL